jgi:arylsulfatase A-like enzyme
VLAAGKCDEPLQITDWMPTLCTLAGHVPATSPKWDGTDVWPVLTGKQERRSRLLYWTAPGFRSRAVRLGDWKLIEFGSGNAARAELFNLAADPNETNDLAAQRPEQVAELRSRLAAMAKADRDSLARD